MRSFRCLLAFLWLFSLHGFAQRLSSSVLIDATLPAAAPETGYLNMGGTSSTGHRIDVNGRYLSMDGQPWLPVMGEFHFSRYNDKFWEDEILKMKAGGIQVVATYIFWIHHEEIEGEFDWNGQRNLHRFVELCARHKMLVYLRIGPWDHGEARNGGFPDWLLQKKIQLRRNDPEYLRYVDRWYRQIGSQIRRQLWKDGGPIIGVQIENEYGETGPGAGAEHLAKLRTLAIDAGIAPPLFSVTGWPGHDYPAHDVIPVAGGYPDDFWTGLRTDAPPNPVYLFNPDGGLGDMGNMSFANPERNTDLRHYPFLAAEEGGGMETSYHRRPLIQPEDIAALTLTQIGSGVNLYGYYMFHGGTNPKGKLSTLQESQITSYPNDLPVLSYDFQAPIGQFGQQRPSFDRLKLIHYFLASAGADLAPMPVYMPTVRPSGPGDVSATRVALRARGSHGFLFINNYVRKLEMPERKGFQAVIRFPEGELRVPRQPVNLPANSSFVLPVNLDLGPAKLEYSTAQLITHVRNDGEQTWFFFAIPGLTPEFVLKTSNTISVRTSSGVITRNVGSVVVRDILPARNNTIEITGNANKYARIVVLTQQEADEFWLLSRSSGRTLALLSPAHIFANGDQVHVRSTNASNMRAFIFTPPSAGTPQKKSNAAVNLWKEYTFPVQVREVAIETDKVRDAGPPTPQRMGPYIDFRKDHTPMAPEDGDFARAAAWKVRIHTAPKVGLSDLFLKIHYIGDVARLNRGETLLDDDFYNGSTWEIGLKQFGLNHLNTELDLRILPLVPGAKIYLDESAWRGISAPTAEVKEVELLPEYEKIFRPRTRSGKKGELLSQRVLQ